MALFLAASLIVSAAAVSDSRAGEGPSAGLKKTLDLYPFVERYVWKEFF